jgi:hypothetical protein
MGRTRGASAAARNGRGQADARTARELILSRLGQGQQ